MDTDAPVSVQRRRGSSSNKIEPAPPIVLTSPHPAPEATERRGQATFRVPQHHERNQGSHQRHGGIPGSENLL
jgi:hypothetical protein